MLLKLSFSIQFLSRFRTFNTIQCPPSYWCWVAGYGGFVCIDISFCYHNLVALILISTFISTLLKYMVVDVLWQKLIELCFVLLLYPTYSFNLAPLHFPPVSETQNIFGCTEICLQLRSQ